MLSRPRVTAQSNGRGPNLCTVAINRRLLVGSLGVALVVIVAGGYLMSRDAAGPEAGNGADVIMDQPGGVQDPTIGTNAKVTGSTLPVVDIQTNDGVIVSTADLTGQPLILNVWFSTCGPCKRELPGFAAVQADLGDRIRFVGINPQDSAETNVAFAAERGVTYELLRDPDYAFVDGVGITAFPVTLFVRADGTIERQTGELDQASLRAYAEELLG